MWSKAREKFNLSPKMNEPDMIVEILTHNRMTVPQLGREIGISRDYLWNIIRRSKIQHIVPRGDELKEIKKQELIKNYGVVNVFQLEEIKDRSKETMLNKYGVENISQSEKIKKQKKETTMKNYGVEVPIFSDEVKQRMIETNLKRYGTKFSLQNKKVINRRYRTNLKKYGTKFPQQTQEVKDKIFATNLKKYGVRSVLSLPENRTSEHYNRSKYEDQICFMLDDMKIKYTISDRSLLNPYEIDIYIEDLNIAIEFNGNYWHDKDNWKDSIIKEEVTYEECKEHYKTVELAKQGITLYHIWEDEWNTIYNQKQYIKNIIEQAKQSQ